MTDYTEGYIKIWRKLLNWEWADNPFMVALFVHCVIRANWQDTRWHGIELKRGEFATSYGKLSKRTGLSVKQVRNYLKKLENSGEIRARKGHDGKYTIIRVCEYDTYQEGHEKGTTRAQQGHDKGTIGATDKEYKEYKEIKEESGGTSAKPTTHTQSFSDEPTLEEVTEFIATKNMKINPENFYSYYASRGWKDKNGQKVTNWRMMLIHWNLNLTEEEKKAGNNTDDGWLE